MRITADPSALIGCCREISIQQNQPAAPGKGVSSPNPPSQDLYPTLLCVAATSTNDVWAVGSYEENLTNGTYNTLIEHWDGHAWNIVPNPSPGYGKALSSEQQFQRTMSRRSASFLVRTD
jgi:hypothetical protein